MALWGIPDRNYSPWFNRVMKLNAVTHVDPLDTDPEAFEAWKLRCIDRLQTLLGPEPAPVDLRYEVLDSVAGDGYRRDKVVFDVEAHMSVPAYLLTPDDRTQAGPAVLAIHGHGPGKDLVAGLVFNPSPHQDYAHRLAQAGYVVLAPDLRCFGERADEQPEDHYGCDTNLVHAYMAGVSPLTENLFDLRRCLDVLCANPLVDPARIGTVGFSYGGTCALFLAALDERVAAALVAGYFSSLVESHKMPFNMCGSQVLWNMLGQIDHVDLGALIAPRPLLIENGTDDWLFPYQMAEKAVAQLAPLYARLGDPADLRHDVFEGEHQFDPEPLIGFFDGALRR